ncbi:hypothetical protein [Flavobacterium sp. NRK1]|uniref:hypothetical protein n=1 Tax=Flavobacterium sp. NRK1 TaxID=2954929 RepID=UPI00209360C7|nr:hypothetical protein [Flavobacterium sp. NRK1]MCO6148898.1 hypothetical protein [Flavobacterium sp. NRK1]
MKRLQYVLLTVFICFAVHCYSRSDNNVHYSYTAQKEHIFSFDHTASQAVQVTFYTGLKDIQNGKDNPVHAVFTTIFSNGGNAGTLQRIVISLMGKVPDNIKEKLLTLLYPFHNFW